MAALKAARARGRPEKLSAKDKQQIRALLKDPAVRVKDAAKRFGVSVATLYKRVWVVSPTTNWYVLWLTPMRASCGSEPTRSSNSGASARG